MHEHSLTDDPTVAVLHEEAFTSLFNELEKKTNLQRQFLSRLKDALESSTPETYIEKPFQGVDNVFQFRAGDVMRGYCVFSNEVPSYNIFYFLEITDHDYDAYPVAKYDRKAESVLEEMQKLASESRVEDYLRSRNALYTENVNSLLEQL